MAPSGRHPGAKIRVFWPPCKILPITDAESDDPEQEAEFGVSAWFAGTITEYDADTKEHTVLYADKTTENFNLLELSSQFPAWGVFH